jgi:hypothetical protein
MSMPRHAMPCPPSTLLLPFSAHPTVCLLPYPSPISPSPTTSDDRSAGVARATHPDQGPGPNAVSTGRETLRRPPRAGGRRLAAQTWDEFYLPPLAPVLIVHHQNPDTHRNRKRPGWSRPSLPGCVRACTSKRQVSKDLARLLRVRSGPLVINDRQTVCSALASEMASQSGWLAAHSPAAGGNARPKNAPRGRDPALLPSYASEPSIPFTGSHSAPVMQSPAPDRHRAVLILVLPSCRAWLATAPPLSPRVEISWKRPDDRAAALFRPGLLSRHP